MIRSLTIAAVVWLEVLRRKDLYVMAILLIALLMTLVSMNAFGLGTTLGYVKDIGLLLGWIFGWVLAITVAARQLPNEETRGTIIALLAKPISRGELIVGKWLGAWSVVSAATAVFYLATAAVVAIFGGSFGLVTLLQAVLLHAGALGILAAAAILLATRLNHDAACALAYILSLATFLVVPRVPELLVGLSGWRANGLLALYAALPHLELFDMRKRLVHAYGPIPWGLCGAILLYAVLLIAIALIGAYLAYRRKPFSRAYEE
jgi:Cu-processing system permease protein